MGRGGRDQNQALRITSLPRRFSRPEREGQRRYFVEQINSPWGSEEDKHIREPGYLRASGRQIIEAGGPNDASRARLTVSEEMAIADKDGNLSWVGTGFAKNVPHDGFLDLYEARRFCDDLNNGAF